jgi:hypothetical protein
MPRYLVTYDFKETNPKPHKAFILAAEKERLLYIFKAGDGKLYRLPNTTLWGDFASAQAAWDAFDRAEAAADSKLPTKIVVEKRVLTLFSEGLLGSDRSKAPEQTWTGSNDFETCRNHQLNDPYFVY